jgi:hypothetical protein
MPDFTAPVGFTSQCKQAILRAGKKLERSTRHFCAQLQPQRFVHNLHWQLRSSDVLRRWTDERLQLGDHYWLFILGLNNSGTTLLVDLLQSHPLMRWLPNEGHFLTRALPLPRTFGVPRNFSQRLDIFHWTEANDPAPALRIKYDWAIHYPRRPGILLEKSPPNAVRSRWLQHNFQPSRFLAIVRHPYAVCEGIRRREGYPIDLAARHWARAHEQMLDDIDHLQYCLLLTYEDLCARPAEHLQNLQDFLGLEQPFDPGVLTRPRRIHNIDNAEGLIRDFNRRSVQQLAAQDMEMIDQIAGPVMARLGYESLRERCGV